MQNHLAHTFMFSPMFMPNRSMADTTLEATQIEYETQAGTKESVQFRTTVPKSLADAMGWEKGDKLEWEVESKRKLSVQKK